MYRKLTCFTQRETPNFKKVDAQDTVFQQLKIGQEWGRDTGRVRPGSYTQETGRWGVKFLIGATGRVVEWSKKQTWRKGGKGRNVSSSAAGQGLKLARERVWLVV